ncbi:MAG TPA: hypothetical protein VNN10_05950 [Dehalococcoidia bacterium]|nr:hypothetical protein [Dehalococcoidia bacterium]
MAVRTNYRYIPPLDPGAEKACRLTRDTAAARAEPPDVFFATATRQEVLPDGYELRFSAGPGIAERIDTFISEEQECCPFFAFERWREDGDEVLRILRIDDDPETPESLPETVLRPRGD